MKNTTYLGKNGALPELLDVGLPQRGDGDLAAGRLVWFGGRHPVL